MPAMPYKHFYFHQTSLCSSTGLQSRNNTDSEVFKKYLIFCLIFQIRLTSCTISDELKLFYINYESVVSEGLLLEIL